MEKFNINVSLSSYYVYDIVSFAFEIELLHDLELFQEIRFEFPKEFITLDIT